MSRQDRLPLTYCIASRVRPKDRRTSEVTDAFCFLADQRLAISTILSSVCLSVTMWCIVALRVGVGFESCTVVFLVL